VRVWATTAMTASDVTTWSRPSPKLLRMRLVEFGVVGAAAGVAAAIAGVSGRAVAVTLAMVVVVGVVAVSAAVAGRRYRAWGYLERADDLLIRRGVLVRRLTIVPYGRMQLVEVTAGLAERLFGLSTVKLHTAAARSDARIPGLEPDEAARLRDRLAALGEAKAAGL
jgi:uncharacterized protein